MEIYSLSVRLQLEQFALACLFGKRSTNRRNPHRCKGALESLYELR